MNNNEVIPPQLGAKQSDDALVNGLQNLALQQQPVNPQLAVNGSVTTPSVVPLNLQHSQYDEVMQDFKDVKSDRYQHKQRRATSLPTIHELPSRSYACRSVKRPTPYMIRHSCRAQDVPAQSEQLTRQSGVGSRSAEDAKSRRRDKKRVAQATKYNAVIRALREQEEERVHRENANSLVGAMERMDMDTPASSQTLVSESKEASSSQHPRDAYSFHYAHRIQEIHTQFPQLTPAQQNQMVHDEHLEIMAAATPEKAQEKLFWEEYTEQQNLFEMSRVRANDGNTASQGHGVDMPSSRGPFGSNPRPHNGQGVGYGLDMPSPFLSNSIPNINQGRGYGLDVPSSSAHNPSTITRDRMMRPGEHLSMDEVEEMASDLMDKLDPIFGWGLSPFS